MSTLRERSEKRAIQPCYDAMQTQNWRSGIAQCNKAIKSITTGPRFHIALSLLALYHLRNHDSDLAIETSSRLETLGVDDEEALRFMNTVMTDLGRAKFVPHVYEIAVKKNPDNANLAIGLCFSYVILQDWDNAQKVAFKMHKEFEDPRPVYWATYCLYAQATTVSAPKEQAVQLMLAHHLISTSPDPAQTPSHIHLYVKVLLARAEASEPPRAKADSLREAWMFLESDKAKQTGKGQLEVEEVRWEVVTALGGLAVDEDEGKVDVWEFEWKRCDAKIRGLSDPRDFNHLTYLHLIDLALLIASKRPNVVQETRDTFAFMIAEVGGKERGPLLASLELEKQLAVRDEAEKESAQRALPELIQAYFSTFSTKACCFEDVRPYLPTDQQAIDALRQELTPTMEKKPTSAKEVYTLINAHKIVRYLSEASSDNNAASLVQEELELATKLMEHHRNGLEYGKDLVKTELQPADDLAILAANALARAWHLTNDSSHLFRAIVFLEHAQRSSIQNHYFRLLLIRMYRILGAPSLTYPRFKALKIASVQHDTLSHVLFTRATMFAAEDEGREMRELNVKAVRYYEGTDSELPELVMGAFGNESYPQIGDFITFHERIFKSLQRKIFALDTIRTTKDVSQADMDSTAPFLESILAADKGDDRLRDNRDFKLTPSYQPWKEKKVETLPALGPEIDASWLCAFSAAYLALFKLPLRLDISLPAPALAVFPPPSSLTEEETLLFNCVPTLLDFAKSLDGSDPHAVETPSAVISFFSSLETHLRTVLPTSPGWQLLHTASLALEGYSFLLLAIRDRRAHPTTAKGGKKVDRMTPAVQAAIVGAKASLRAIATLLRTAADAAGSSGRKAYQKSCSNLGIIGIDSEFVLSVATDLGNARKSALLALGRKISEEIRKD